MYLLGYEHVHMLLYEYSVACVSANVLVCVDLLTLMVCMYVCITVVVHLGICIKGGWFKFFFFLLGPQPFLEPFYSPSSPCPITPSSVKIACLNQWPEYNNNNIRLTVQPGLPCLPKLSIMLRQNYHVGQLAHSLFCVHTSFFSPSPYSVFFNLSLILFYTHKHACMCVRVYAVSAMMIATMTMKEEANCVSWLKAAKQQAKDFFHFLPFFLKERKITV